MHLPAELSVGFEELDRQHGVVLEALEAACRSSLERNLPALRAAAAALGDALVAHFAAEEAFMEESLYPDRARHKAAHDLFMQDFAQLGRELQGAVLTDHAARWVNTRVPEWVKFHIRVNDEPLGRFLAARRFRPRAPAAAAPKSQAS